MEKTLENYLRNGIEYGNVIDFALRAQITEDGRVTFYIRAEDHDGDTADFEVRGNVLTRNQDVLDWDAAQSHFDEIMQGYKDLLGVPGVLTAPALAITFDPLLRRFNSGERTKELHEEMVNVE